MLELDVARESQRSFVNLCVNEAPLSGCVRLSICVLQMGCAFSGAQATSATALKSGCSLVFRATPIQLMHENQLPLLLSPSSKTAVRLCWATNFVISIYSLLIARTRSAVVLRHFARLPLLCRLLRILPYAPSPASSVPL